MAEAFLSYAREDLEFAVGLGEMLGALELDLWKDVDGIYAGESFWPVIESAIDASDAFAFVISPHSIESEHCLAELERAVEAGKRVLPILREDVDENALPEPLRSRQWTFMRETDPLDSACAALVAAAKTDVSWTRGHTRWLVRARAWESKGRDASRLLRGKELEAAERWLSESPHPANDQARPETRGESVDGSVVAQAPRVTPLHEEFIARSRTVTTRRRRWIAAAVSVAVLAVAALSLLNLRRQRERDVAQSVGLAEQALTQLENNRIDTALLLSVAALDLEETLEARGSLLSSLVQEPRSRLLDFLPGNGGAVQALRFSVDGEELAVATCDVLAAYDELTNAYCQRGTGTVSVWELGRLSPERRELVGTGHVIRDLSFDPADRTLLWVDADGSLKRWDLANGRARSQMRFEEPSIDPPFVPIWKVASSAGILAAASWENVFLVRDLTDDQPLTGLVREHVFPDASPYRPGPSGAIAVDPVHRRLALESAELGGVVLWDIDRRLTVGAAPGGHAARVTNLAFSADGQRLASSGLDGEVVVWDLSQVEPAELWRRRAEGVRALSFHPDGSLLAVAACAGPLEETDDSDEPPRCRRGEVALWRADTGERAAPPFAQHAAEVTAVGFHPDGQTVASGDASGKVVRWSLEPRPSLVRFTARIDQVAGVVFAGERSGAEGDLHLVTAGAGGITLRDPLGGTARTSAPLASGLRLRPGAVSAGGGVIAVGGCSSLEDEDSDDERLRCSQGTTEVWTIGSGGLDDGELVHGHENWVTSVAVSPGGDTVATAGLDGQVRLWRRGEDGWRDGPGLSDHETSVLEVAFSADGGLLASRDRHGRVLLWSTDSGGRIGKLTGLSGASPFLGMLLGPIAFGPEAGLLATTHREAGIGVVEIRADRLGDGKAVAKELAPGFGDDGVHRPFQSAEEGTPGDLAFSPDGRILASAGRDRSVTLWDVGKRKRFARPLAGTVHDIVSVAFGPAGETLAVAGGDGVTLWDLDPTSWREQACRRVHRELTPEEWIEFFGDQAFRPICAGR